MFRSTFLALAATCGLFGANEFSNNTANADHIHVGVIARPVVVLRPVTPIYCPPPRVIVYSPPVIVTPVCAYNVYFRPCPVDPWQLYGTFASPLQARDAMTVLTVRGFQVMETQR